MARPRVEQAAEQTREAAAKLAEAARPTIELAAERAKETAARAVGNGHGKAGRTATIRIPLPV